MPGRGRGVACVLCACLVAAMSGCSVAGHYLWPDERRSHSFDRRITVSVNSEPPAAVVRVDAEQVGATPLTYRTSYRVERAYSRPSSTGWKLGCVVDTAAMVYVAGALFFDAPFPDDTAAIYAVTGWATLGSTGCLLTWARRSGWLGTKPRTPTRVEQREHPRAIEMHATWPGHPPETTRIVVPRDERVTLRRRSPATFDDALVLWDQQRVRDPAPEGLYNLGQAYVRRYSTTGAAGDRARATTYLTRYLATEAVPPARRQQVEAQLTELGAAGRGDR